MDLTHIINNIKVRNILQDGYKDVIDYLDDEEIDRLLIHVFCGIGKSRLMYKICVQALQNEPSDI